MPGIVNVQGFHQQYTFGLFIVFHPDWESVLLCCPAPRVPLATNILQWHTSEVGLIYIDLEDLPQLQWLGRHGFGQHNFERVLKCNMLLVYHDKSWGVPEWAWRVKLAPLLRSMQQTFPSSSLWSEGHIPAHLWQKRAHAQKYLKAWKATLRKEKNAAAGRPE